MIELFYNVLRDRCTILCARMIVLLFISISCNSQFESKTIYVKISKSSLIDSIKKNIYEKKYYIGDTLLFTEYQVGEMPIKKGKNDTIISKEKAEKIIYLDSNFLYNPKFSLFLLKKIKNRIIINDKINETKELEPDGENISVYYPYLIDTINKSDILVFNLYSEGTSGYIEIYNIENNKFIRIYKSDFIIFRDDYFYDENFKYYENKSGIIQINYRDSYDSKEVKQYKLLKDKKGYYLK